MIRITFLLRLCIFFCASIPAAALAQAAAEASPAVDQDASARQTFQAGRDAFNRGDYESALVEFQRAYDLSQRPALLYNIATTLDRLRRDEEALAAWRSYLEHSPDAEDRDEVSARIRVLEAALASRTANSNASVSSTQDSESNALQQADAPPPEESSGWTPAVFWVSAGMTVAAGATAATFGVLTLGANDDYESYASSENPELAKTEQLYEDARDKELLTNVLIGVSAGLAAWTVVTAILTDWDGGAPHGESSAHVRASATPVFGLTPDNGWVGIQGSF